MLRYGLDSSQAISTICLPNFTTQLELRETNNYTGLCLNQNNYREHGEIMVEKKPTKIAIQEPIILGSGDIE